MIPEKATITIYKFNSETVLKHFKDEQAGRLFKAILQYGQDGKKTDFSDDGMISMMFDLYCKGIDELDEKYQNKVEKRKKAARDGWKNKKEQCLPMQSNAEQCLPMQTDTKQTEEFKAKQSNRNIYVDGDGDGYGDGDGDGDGEIYGEGELNNNIVPDTFEKIWNAYPLREGKDRACRAYIERIKEGWGPDQLLKAAEHYAIHCKNEETEKKYIIRLWNFFGNKTFVDYIEDCKNEQEDGNRGDSEIWDSFFG